MQNVVIKKIDLSKNFAGGVYFFLSEAQNPIPFPLLHTVYVYTIYLFTQGRVGKPERRREGQQFTKLVDNTNMTYCISSLPQSPIAEPVFVNVYGAQESIPRNRFCQPI
jgi:hypothetical protein